MALPLDTGVMGHYRLLQVCFRRQSRVRQPGPFGAGSSNVMSIRSTTFLSVWTNSIMSILGSPTGPKGTRDVPAAE